jgi:hypothetical protein
MNPESLEPCRFDERTARVLGLPLLAVTPTARLVANRTEWLWFDPAEGLAIWRGPDGQHGFPAASLEEALACVGRPVAERHGRGANGARPSVKP